MHVTAPSASPHAVRTHAPACTRCLRRHCLHSDRRADSAAQSASRAAASFLAALQVGAATLALAQPPAAQAVLRSPNANISRSVETALRRSIPPFNSDVHTVQDKLEDIQYLLRIPQRKPWGSMANDVRATQALASSQGKMMAAVPTADQPAVAALLDELLVRLERLQFAIERQDADKTSQAVARALATVADIELIQAPALSFLLPKEYQDLPLLTGRAVVEMVVEKANKAAAFVDVDNGGLLDKGIVRIALDGYSAPVSAGNFAKLVSQGKYDGRTFSTGYSSVITGSGANPGTSVPLEILPIGEFSPVYRSPLDIAGGELPVLPLSIRGAVAMTRLQDTDQYLSGDEFFIHKFSFEQGGLSGLAFDEGMFGVFGYVTEGMEEVIAKLEDGDRIVSARIISGKDRLKNVT